MISNERQEELERTEEEDSLREEDFKRFRHIIFSNEGKYDLKPEIDWKKSFLRPGLRFEEGDILCLEKLKEHYPILVERFSESRLSKDESITPLECF